MHDHALAPLYPTLSHNATQFPRSSPLRLLGGPFRRKRPWIRAITGEVHRRRLRKRRCNRSVLGGGLQIRYRFRPARVRGSRGPFVARARLRTASSCAAGRARSPRRPRRQLRLRRRGPLTRGGLLTAGRRAECTTDGHAAKFAEVRVTFAGAPAPSVVSPDRRRHCERGEPSRRIDELGPHVGSPGRVRARDRTRTEDVHRGRPRPRSGFAKSACTAKRTQPSEDYCRDRWEFDASRARQLISAAKTVTVVTVGSPRRSVSASPANCVAPVTRRPRLGRASPGATAASDLPGSGSRHVGDALTELDQAGARRPRERETNPPLGGSSGTSSARRSCCAPPVT